MVNVPTVLSVIDTSELSVMLGKDDGWHSRKVTNFSQRLTGFLITCFMEHHMLTHSLHFNDYKSELN